MKRFFGFDISLRSTGCTVLDEDGKIVDMLLIRTPTSIKDGEEIIAYQYSFIKRWIPIHLSREIKPYFLVEKLAYGGLNSRKDLIAGVLWMIRWTLYEMTESLSNDVAVNEWRARVITKDIRKQLKEQGIQLKGEELKIQSYNLLPTLVKETICNYIAREGLTGKKTEYDLCDSYWIAEFCRQKYKGETK